MSPAKQIDIVLKLYTMNRMYRKPSKARARAKHSARLRSDNAVRVAPKKAAMPSGMRKIAAADVRRHFAGTIDSVRMTRDRLVIDRHGISVAAIVPIEDAELLEALENADDIRVARKRM